MSVFHVLTGTEFKEEERQAKGNIRAKSTPCPKGQLPISAVSQQGVKRTCGNAQKSVRVKHNSIPALKHK